MLTNFDHFWLIFGRFLGPKSIQNWSSSFSIVSDQNFIIFAWICAFPRTEKSSKTIGFSMVFEDFHMLLLLTLWTRRHPKINDVWTKKTWKKQSKNNQTLVKNGMPSFDLFLINFWSILKQLLVHFDTSWPQHSAKLAPSWPKLAPSWPKFRKVPFRLWECGYIREDC